MEVDGLIVEVDNVILIDDETLTVVGAAAPT